MKVNIKNLQKKVPIYPRRIKKAILKTLSKKRIKKSGEITVCFVSDCKIKAFNLKYLGRDNPTDVIAFNLSGQGKQDKISADIAISAYRAIDNAVIFGTSPLFELYLYVIHGVLHILGYKDYTKNDKLLMRKKENKLLEALKFSSG